jgi:GT2 family glycosyltransferase
MALFKNVTNFPIPVMINGSRRLIKAGELVHGPENLISIPGIVLIKDTTKTVIPQPTNVNIREPIPVPVSISAPKRAEPVTVVSQDGNIKTDLSAEINTEIEYLTEMKNLGRNPTVTIAILTKNAFNLITDCCNSIFAKVKYEHVTLAICDTGTTNGQVKDYYNTLPDKCKELGWKYKFIQLESYHFSKNYNDVARQTDTDYILIQNNDTVARNDYVTEMMYAGILRRVGSVGCRMLYRDDTIQHDGQSLFNGPNETFGGLGHVNLKRSLNQVPADENFMSLAHGNTAAGALMRTKEYIQIGGMDERYKDIFQDVDLMVKIPHMLNKFNYCNKEAVITHLDNASRFGEGSDPKRNAAMWDDTAYIKERVISNNWIQFKRPRQYDISIITLVYNFDHYKDFLNSIKLQNGSHQVEIIGIPNFFNMFKSAYKGLNIATDTANGKYIIYCHDDIIVDENWLNKIKAHIGELESQNVNWGVLGPAGVFLDSSKCAFYLKDHNGQPVSRTNSSVIREGTRHNVFSLDELCLITKKSNKLRFTDKLMHGFHFYGANLCVEAITRGMKNYAIDAYCYHRSDGTKNISSPEKYKIYETCAKNFHNYAKLKGLKSWRTTTAMAANDTITLFAKSNSS